MQVKRFFFVLTVLLGFLPSGFAQDLLPRPIVRLIYVLPNDRAPQPDIDEKLDRLIKDVQAFYAQHMENHGFDRKTFLFETDAQGKAIVHHVKSRFNHTYFQNNWRKVSNKFFEPFRISPGQLPKPTHYFGVFDVNFPDYIRHAYGGGDGREGAVYMTVDHLKNWRTAAHELGHAFGLMHDYRPFGGNWKPVAVGDRSPIGDPMITSFCAAEWLDAIPAFNAPQTPINQETTIEMLGLPTLGAAPHTFHFRFKVQDSDGLHQVQLHMLDPSVGHDGDSLLDYKGLKGVRSSTLEFVSSILLGATTSHVVIKSIDVHGDTRRLSYPVDMTLLLPPSEAVSIPDANLAAAVRREIGSSITTHTLLNLRQLLVLNLGITRLTGLEHARNLAYLQLYSSTAISDVSPLAGLKQLTSLILSNNAISDVSPLAGLKQLTYLDLYGNAISDVSPLAGLKQLTNLYLSNNAISDVSPLAGLKQLTNLRLSNTPISDVSPLAGLKQLTNLRLSNNAISDVSSLVELNLTGSRGSSTGLSLSGNPLNYASINTHIPAMQARGIEVQFHNRTPKTSVKISGDGQEGLANTTLSFPFVVEVKDQRNQAFAGVPVTFAITAGSGRLSITSTTTDLNGRAQSRLTLGRTAGTTTVRVTAAKISQPVQFTATTNLLSTPVAIPDASLRAAVASALDKVQEDLITVGDMLRLTQLTASNANIYELTGLEQAVNLEVLSLDNNNLSNVTVLAALPRLETLSLNNNNLSDVAPLAALTELMTLSLNNNDISDVARLMDLSKLKTLSIRENPLNYSSLHTHLPAMQASGTVVAVDLRTPTTFVQISGSRGMINAASSLIVEVRDEKGFGFSGVPVKFTVTAGGGTLAALNVVTDSRGRARTSLTLGSIPGRNTVRVTAAEAPRTLSLTITGIDPNSSIEIPDANLRAKVAAILSKPRDAQLTAGDMLALTRLDVQNASIRDLTGLENAHNLRTLNLGGEYLQGTGYVNSNTVSDFSRLEGLNQLTYLDLGKNKLTDISSLSGLNQLTYLSLGSNKLTDISPLSGLNQLTYLHLGKNTITDVSPLSGLSQLKTLYLFSNELTDISPLSGLSQLKTLYLSINELTDISPLSGLNQLTNLSLGSNELTDISPLSGLNQLIRLSLGNNTIADVSPLSGLSQLTYLYLRNNKVTDVSPLVGLNLTGTELNSIGLYLQMNPLNYASINTHIPAMQAKGIKIVFDNRAHPILLKISGDGQEGLISNALAAPFVVEAQDENGKPMSRVTVTFTIETGEGVLNPIKTQPDADGKVQTTLTLGWTPGTITIRATATGIQSSVHFTAIATVPADRTAADVNGDGNVDVDDLIFVASSFGAVPIPGVFPDTDVNNDGEVNKEDVTLVLAALEAAPAAPSLDTQWTVSSLQRWIAEAKQRNIGDATFQRGIKILEKLLEDLLPKQTLLLANYPNPFNPETWIPYQLSEPGDVIVHIYGVNGVLVRTLGLGHQLAGTYQSRTRAAYWDGHNQLGEPVASGVYFYTLSAGDFTATRKMLIRK